MNFKLPAHQLPQPHIMKLKIGSALNPSEMFHLIMSKDEHEIHSDMAHTVCSINFINSVICNELFTIVFDWHEALPSLAKQKKALVFLRDHPGRFTELIKIMFVLSGIYALVAVTHLLLNASSSSINSQMFLKRSYDWLAASFMVIYFSYLIGSGLASWARANINRMSKPHIFSITKGDRNRVEEINLKNNTLLLQLCIKILASIIILLIGLFFNVIIEPIFKLLVS
jgi:hypothetical protein